MGAREIKWLSICESRTAIDISSIARPQISKLGTLTVRGLLYFTTILLFFLSPGFEPAA